MVAVANNKIYNKVCQKYTLDGGSDGKASVYNAGDPGLSPGLGRSPGEGDGNPLQYYCLVNPMDRGAWQAAVLGVAKIRTRLIDFTYSLIARSAFAFRLIVGECVYITIRTQISQALLLMVGSKLK